jgi:recombinational DNA repair protein RecT
MSDEVILILEFRPTEQNRIGSTNQDRAEQGNVEQDKTARSSVVLKLTSSMSSPSSAMQVATSTLVSPRLNDCNAT